jgi:hypothetical protein
MSSPAHEQGVGVLRCSKITRLKARKAIRAYGHIRSEGLTLNPAIVVTHTR